MAWPPTRRAISTSPRSMPDGSRNSGRARAPIRRHSLASRSIRLGDDQELQRKQRSSILVDSLGEPCSPGPMADVENLHFLSIDAVKNLVSVSADDLNATVGSDVTRALSGLSAMSSI